MWKMDLGLCVRAGSEFWLKICVTDVKDDIWNFLGSDRFRVKWEDSTITGALRAWTVFQNGVLGNEHCFAQLFYGTKE